MNGITSAWRSLRQNHDQTVKVGGGIIIAALFGFLLWWLLDLYIKPDEAEVPSTAKKDLMQAWGFIMAGVAGGVGVYFTWRNLRSTQDNLRLTEQGQITERFTQAIEQLGATDDNRNKRLEIRLGGIYALEHIANDSPERYYSTIMEVLTAYVRENAQRQPEETRPPSVEPDEDDEASTELEKKQPPKPPADIQAILTVLGRRKKAGEKDDVVLDLKATDLRGAVLTEADLRKVNLREADLRSADLRNANLQEADLFLAKLQKANLMEAILEDQNLFEANLQGQLLAKANLRGANLKEANLRGANLKEANLQGADLVQAKVQRATLSEANLKGAILEGTAILYGVEGLTQEQLDSANGDENTKLPDNYLRPAHWSKGGEEA